MYNKKEENGKEINQTILNDEMIAKIFGDFDCNLLDVNRTSKEEKQMVLNDGEKDKDLKEYCQVENDDFEQHYEQYNGYNGWSDEEIDTAFEGDPEATWNVD